MEDEQSRPLNDSPIQQQVLLAVTADAVAFVGEGVLADGHLPQAILVPRSPPLTREAASGGCNTQRQTRP